MAECVALAMEVLKSLEILKEWCPPDNNNEEILSCFHQLSAQIDQVRADIKDLEKMIKWEVTELQYGDVVQRITLGMQHYLAIGKSTGKAEMRY